MKLSIQTPNKSSVFIQMILVSENNKRTESDTI